MFNTIYIYGLGMMGGSLALSMKANKVARNIFAYDANSKALIFAKKNKIIDDYDVKDFKLLKSSDLIIIATPISSYQVILERISKFKKNSALITDIGSTKKSVIKVAQKIFKDDGKSFIGSHPLAGSEKTTLHNSNKMLFENAMVILSSVTNTNKISLSIIKKFWKKLRCNIKYMDPSQHDLLMSKTSHIPHLLSYALVSQIFKNRKTNDIKDFTGGGFKDFARIASSDPLMWKDICSSNKTNILSSLNSLGNEIDMIRNKIKNDDYSSLQKYFKKIQSKLDS